MQNPESLKSIQSVSLGYRLRQLREEHNMSQENLAQKLYLTRQTISSWERNRSQPDISMLQSLAEIYQVSIDEILHGVDRVVRKPSRWRWLFLAASGVVFLIICIQSISMPIIPENITIGIMGGANGPETVYTVPNFPPIPAYFASVILPMVNLAISMFCIYWMIKQANYKEFGFYKVIAIALISLAVLYILIQLFGILVLGFFRNDMGVAPGTWLSFIRCLLHPGFWVTLLVGVYALCKYLQKLKVAYGA